MFGHRPKPPKDQGTPRLAAPGPAVVPEAESETEPAEPGEN